MTLHAGIWTAPAPTALELLAPARDADAGIAAIDHGADAVYIGGPAFGARAAAGNSLDDIARLTAYAHRFNARVFLALNTLFTNEELPLARKLAFELADAGADILILQDMGLLEGPLPDIELHASTQCDIRTPEKAAFLESVGFSQLVLARELSLPEIAAVRAKLQHARIEFFVHGALCVSYSGQCWMSQALTGRSANRGECSQLCRLPYDVYTEAGTELAKSKHVLSLKDNDQSANLEALIDAGVSSFKIEGRLKGAAYVKNVTAFYRRKLDEIIARRPELSRTSQGDSAFTFEPAPEKVFNRGQTDYFVHGRQYDQPYELAELESPKHAGEPAAVAEEVLPGRIIVKSLPGVTFANGDGLTYLADDEEIRGIAVNRAEPVLNKAGKPIPHLWMLHTLERRRMDGLRPGLVLKRNRDHAFLRMMEGKTAESPLISSLRRTKTAWIWSPRTASDAPLQALHSTCRRRRIWSKTAPICACSSLVWAIRPLLPPTYSFQKIWMCLCRQALPISCAAPLRTIFLRFGKQNAKNPAELPGMMLRLTPNVFWASKPIPPTIRLQPFMLLTALG